MYKTSLIIVCLGLLATVQAVPGATCTQDCQCDCGECCQILSDFPIMSKRASDLFLFKPPSKTGTCQNYRTEGQYCGYFLEANGYCGCAPGLECRSQPQIADQVQSSDPTERKRLVIGYSKCELP